jgi:hypothetical protein
MRQRPCAVPPLQVSKRFQGSIFACKAVARFIYRRGGGAELAGPLLQTAAAFEDLARGGKPRLFLKKSTPEKERERSPERKHIQMLAAAALEVMIRLTPRGARAWDENTTKRANAADSIARYVNKWPGMGAQEVTGRTLIAWRDHQRKLSKTRKQFDVVVEKILAEQDPRKAVDQLFSLKSNQMVEGSVCIGLRASCSVCARPAKWRA